jgi:Na+-translocating ferredoxin:NAD+ oxidoreductase RnfC subunit
MSTTATNQNPSISNTFYTSLFNVPDGERIRKCLQCGDCSGICPFGYLMVYPPSRMIAFLRAERFNKVLDTDTVWMCVSCYACTTVCPSQIPLTPGLMTRAKEELLLAGNVPTELQSALWQPSWRITSQASRLDQRDRTRGQNIRESQAASGRLVVRRRLSFLSPPCTVIYKSNDQNPQRPGGGLWYPGT